MVLSRPVLIAAGCLVSLAKSAAPIITNNIAGTGYVAQLTAGPGTITGSIQLVASTNATGVLVDLSLNGFNLTDSTEYTYHIHQHPVPENGSCNSTGAHFDQYGVSDDYVCDSSQSDLCQLGDLSGKHGAITFANGTGTNTISLQYTENYLSTNPDDVAYFGNLSIVVHRKRDKFRFNCGNLVPLTASNATGSAVPGETSPIYSNTTSTDVVATQTVMGSSTTAPGGTSTEVVQGTQTASPHATSTGSGSSSSGNGIGVSTGDAEETVRTPFLAWLIGLSFVVGFA